jgi:xanthine dehydrogenase YagS FAD-binding subunit
VALDDEEIHERIMSDAAAMLAVAPAALFLAGGTHLVDHMKLGVAPPDLLVDVRRSPPT